MISAHLGGSGGPAVAPDPETSLEPVLRAMRESEDMVRCADVNARLLVLVALLLAVGVQSGSARSERTVGLIAFARGCAIFVIKTDGSGERRLTDQAKGCAGSPAWSPDGRRIAFVRWYDDPSGQNRDFPGAIYVVDADGSGTRQLTRRAFRIETLKWSPDGRSVAFDRTGGIFLVDARSSRVRPLAPRHRYLREPDWSPDGARLAVTGPDASPGDKRPISRIYVLKRDGTALQPVTRGRPGGQDLLPLWSHDGQSLLFMRTSDEVWTVARQGGKERRVGRGAISPFPPSWSPDDRWIVFLGDGVWVVRADGSGGRRLTTGDYSSTPAWSRDGREVLFGRNDSLFAVNRDGSGVRRIARGHSGTWQPRSPA